MEAFRIFAEGKADVKFLKDFISTAFQIRLEDSHFDTMGSWSGYKAGGNISTKIQQTHDDKKTIILIVDADSDYKMRLEEITTDFSAYNIPLDIFLFPNHSDNGNLETILAEIAVDRKIMNCFLEYEKCVDGHPKPLNDSRIYAYLDMLLHPNPINENRIDLRKDAFRNYENTDHWNLHHDYLAPLRKFLQPFLTAT